MKSATLACITSFLLSACATQVLDAPPAPCASIQHDCGPARPLNVAGAPADRGPVVHRHG